MNKPTGLTAMKLPRKAKYGFKAPLRESNLFSLIGWLRVNLPDPDDHASPWWFTLNNDQMNIYTNDPLVVACVNAQIEKEAA